MILLKKQVLVIFILLLILSISSNRCLAAENASKANLQILRLQYEGISPEFNKATKEYYLVVDDVIDRINITAVPEDENATVSITGNDNLQYGRNVIDIAVVSADKKETQNYKIYVTRTTNKELANANLETLAVRQGDLHPEFNHNVTKYNMEIANGEYRLDVLAIPQREVATIEIIGSEEIKEGDNLVQVLVLAEDKITEKKYEIAVHRRSIEEEAGYIEERESQAERLSMILSEGEAEPYIERETANIPLLIGAGIVTVIATTTAMVLNRKRG